MPDPRDYTYEFTPGMTYLEFLEANPSLQGLSPQENADVTRIYGELLQGEERTYSNVPGQETFPPGEGPEEPLADTSAANLLREQLERISDPRYGLEEFQRLSAASAPSPSTISGLGRLGGGLSQAQLAQLTRQSSNQARSAAFPAFGQFRTGLEGITAGISENLLRNEEFAQQLGQQAELFEKGQLFQAGEAAKGRRADFRNSIFSGLLGAGGTLLGGYLNRPRNTGGGTGGFNPTAPFGAGNQFGSGNPFLFPYPGQHQFGGGLSGGGIGVGSIYPTI